MEKISRNIINIISRNFAIKCALGVMLIFAGSQITIPMKPVDVTLHTLVTLLIGLTYKPKEAATTFIAYISLGLLGMPMSTKSLYGLAYFMGPSGAYVPGMLLAATSMAYIRTYMGAGTLLACIVGQMLIYIPGVTWLSTFIGIEAAIYKGFLVFIPSGIIKLLILLGIFKALKK